MSRRPAASNPVRRRGDVRRRMWSESRIPKPATRRVRGARPAAPAYDYMSYPGDYYTVSGGFYLGDGTVGVGDPGDPANDDIEVYVCFWANDPEGSGGDWPYNLTMKLDVIDTGMTSFGVYILPYNEMQYGDLFFPPYTLQFVTSGSMTPILVGTVTGGPFTDGQTVSLDFELPYVNDTPTDYDDVMTDTVVGPINFRSGVYTSMFFFGLEKGIGIKQVGGVWQAVLGWNGAP